MLFKDMLKQGIDILEKNNISDAQYDAKLIAMSVFELKLSDLLMVLLDEADEEKVSIYFEKINKRATHYPCQYIIGNACFMGYEFKVAENVLIPRPETELLVEKAVELANYTFSDKPLKALDMCTGTGCIGISFLLTRMLNKKATDVTLVDISEHAYSLATENVNRLCKEYDIDRALVNIVKSDLFGSVNGKFDIIMSNPPYIPSADIEELADEVKVYEPRLALDGDRDGLLFYRKIAKEAKEYLNDNGYLIFEIGHNQFEDISRILVDFGYMDIELIKDYAGLDRIIVAHI